MKSMICLILDRSGSMAGRENDVVGGVNSFIEEQKKLPDPAAIAFVRFDTEAVERFRAMQSLAEMQPLTRDEYQPRGGTPLLDAIGKTIGQLEEDWKREQPERAIVVIVTDGEENSSHEFTKPKIKELIEARTGSGKRSFIYLGANVDAFHEAGGLGIMASNAAGYVNTSAGTKAMYAAASNSIYNMRATGNVVAQGLGGNIAEDGTVKKDKDQLPTAKAQASPWAPPNQTTAWTPPA